jgi:hypothetical protein
LYAEHGLFGPTLGRAPERRALHVSTFEGPEWIAATLGHRRVVGVRVDLTRTAIDNRPLDVRAL